MMNLRRNTFIPFLFPQLISIFFIYIPIHNLNAFLRTDICLFMCELARTSGRISFFQLAFFSDTQFFFRHYEIIYSPRKHFAENEWIGSIRIWMIANSTYSKHKYLRWRRYRTSKTETKLGLCRLSLGILLLINHMQISIVQISYGFLRFVAIVTFSSFFFHNICLERKQIFCNDRFPLRN